MPRTPRFAWPLALTLLCAALLPRPSEGQVPDSIAHPIQTGCGARLDPVAYVRGRAAELKLSAAQLEGLKPIDRTLRAANEPLGEAWWALPGTGDNVQERRARILGQLKANYRVALHQLKALLSPDQWQEALRPAQEGVRPMVRCLARSVLVILGGDEGTGAGRLPTRRRP